MLVTNFGRSGSRSSHGAGVDRMKTTKSRTPYVACLALLLALVSAAAEAKWLELQTSDFRIVSATDQSRTLKIAQGIEVWQASVAKVLPRADMHPHVPVTLLLLPANLYHQYSGLPATVGGAAIPLPSAAFIIVNADTWDKASSTVFHEIAHILLHQISRDTSLPVWYDEGYADFLSTVEPMAGGLAKVGMPPPQRVATLLGMLPWMPIKDVLMMTRANPNYTSERMGATFYAESWLLIHYSVFGNQERRRQIDLYRALLDKNVAPDQAFEAAFPNDNGELEKEIKAYRRSNSWLYAKVGPITVPPLATDRVREIAKVDGINEIGAWQLANRSVLNSRRLALLVDNAKGQPAQSVAALQLAKAHLFRDETEPAMKMADAGCDAPLASVRIANLCGDLYAISAARLPVKTENLAAKEDALIRKARAAYESALAIDSTNVESLLAAAATFKTLEGDYTPVRSGLERALERDPTNPEIAYQLATLYRDSDLARTRLLLQQSLANTLDFDYTNRVQGFLDSVEKALAGQSSAEMSSGNATAH